MPEEKPRITNGYVNAYSNIVPAARALIAKELYARGITEENAARLLGVTQAAVSKYLANKYSDEVKTAEMGIDRRIVESYVQGMLDGKKDYIERCICAICRSVNDFGCSVSVKT